MSTPIEQVYTTGNHLYAVIHNPAGTVWNGTAFEAYNSADWSSYAIPMTEQSPSGYYSAAYPTGITGVLTTEVIYLRAGANPADTDTTINIFKSQGVNTFAINYDTNAPVNLQTLLDTEEISTIASGTVSNTAFTTNLPDTAANVYVGRVLVMTSGNAIRCVSTIVAYSGSSKILTLTGLSIAPSVGDSFIII